MVMAFGANPVRDLAFPTSVAIFAISLLVPPPMEHGSSVSVNIRCWICLAINSSD